VPGAIQPHGVLLVVEETGMQVTAGSANAAALFGHDVSGRALADLLSPEDLTALQAGLADLAVLNPLPLRISDLSVDLVAHRSDGRLLLELEPLAGAEQAPAAWHRRLPQVLHRLSTSASLADLADVLADDVRELTGYDRVMIYRFDPQWNGEVIAEAARADLQPFLGLHFPASDIPAQARALYMTNWLRIIPDTAYTPVPLPEADLDLSASVLRSVSPVHLEYLANMGVRSSMSVSLIEDGRLWGLVACHHYAGPHRPSYTDRLAAEFLGRTSSLLLRTLGDTGAGERALLVSERRAQLVAALARTPRTPGAALSSGDVTLLDLLPAGGAAMRLAGRLTLLGDTPSPDRVPVLVGALLASGRTSTDSLVGVLPEAEADLATASGLLAVPVATGPGDFLAWFRPEALREVTWSGDPDAAKRVVERGGVPMLSPRESFARWSETVRATSTPWAAHERAAAEHLAEHLDDLVLVRTHEDNRLAAALQRTLLLEQLPQVPGVALAARYAPSEQDVVGGDWYDLILLPDGHVSIVLGDVAGHGVTVAGITAQLRHALRAYLLRAEGPAAALQALNGLVATLLPGELATAVVADLEPATGRVRLASAGHLPALLSHAAGGAFVEGGRGPALGLIDDGGFQETELTLAPGDRLFVFSDGVVERRGEDLTAGLNAVREAAAVPDRDPDRLIERVLAACGPAGDDDVTVLCLGPA
jgi:serine phosphatase RsbU (regulator of sigma subunit)